MPWLFARMHADLAAEGSVFRAPPTRITSLLSTRFRQEIDNPGAIDRKRCLRDRWSDATFAVEKRAEEQFVDPKNGPGRHEDSTTLIALIARTRKFL